MVTESWLNTLRKSRKITTENNAGVGILASEISNLMLKVVCLWHCLSDDEISRIKTDLSNSAGVKVLVSGDEKYVMELVVNEMLEEFKFLARHVVRLSKKCVDPVYHQYEQFIHDPLRYGLNWLDWQYRLNKMQRKMKKMERFVSAVEELSRQFDVLEQMEGRYKRMEARRNPDKAKLHEYNQKVLCQRQKVESLKDMSPWNRSYDYIVRLMARSLFTILERIIHVYEDNHAATLKESNEFQLMNHTCNSRSATVVPRTTTSPTRKSVSLSGRQADRDKTKLKGIKENAILSQSRLELDLHIETRQSGQVEHFKGCVPTTAAGAMRLKKIDIDDLDKAKIHHAVSVSSRVRIYCKLCIKCQLLKAPPSTLGDAALAYRYANVIILIEKMMRSSKCIGLETRDDLYAMLPTTLRTALRTRLKAFRIGKASRDWNNGIEAEWKLALSQLLEWLGPLAHNTIAWHSGRSFGEEDKESTTNVLLVLTLHYADKAKTEAAIVELLVGLNYICWTSRELKIEAGQRVNGKLK